MPIVLPIPTTTTPGLLWLAPPEFTDWRMRVKAEHLARNLTPARRDALVALQALICTGDTAPTDEAVAALAGCSSRTVRRARADARELGLLTWQQTRRLVAGAWRRGPNTYSLRVSADPVCPSGQPGRASQARKIERAQEPARTVAAQLAAYGLPSLGAAAAELAALNARRAAARRAAMP